jgi:hypothetical protein
MPCSLLAEARQIAAENYDPSIEVCKQDFEKGLVETHLSFGENSFRVLQLNGQPDWVRHRKRIHLFHDVMVLMFFVSLADYDEPGISGVGQRVCESSYVLTRRSICDHTSRRGDWPNTSPFSKQ